MKLEHRLATLVGLAVGLAGVALVPAAAAGSAPAAAGSAPQPAAPAQAQALIGAAAPIATGSTTRRVSAQEALSASSLPGAVVAVSPGLSAAQAVGLLPAVSAPSGSAPTGAAPVVGRIGVTTAATSCSANAQWTEWGIWPYQQRITDTTYWCAVYGDHITYTSSNTSGTGTLCGTSWTSSQIVSGGIGYSWFVNRASAGFNCPTAIPWISLHPSHYEDTSRNAWGSTQLVGTN
jgi:hypothetical protein